MSFDGNFQSEFIRADKNGNGVIDQNEFREYVGSAINDQQRLSSNFNQADLDAFSSSASGATETITYEIGLDVAVAGFTQNPIEYEKYTQAANVTKGHSYGVGPDVGIGAPNVARRSNQYDPAAAMFNFADINSDGKIDQGEFGSFLRSV